MDIFQQVIAKISQVTNILVLASGSNGDSVSAALALRSFLRKLEKDVVVLGISEVAPKFDFLPDIKEVKKSIDLTKSFVIDVSTKKSEVEELSYKKENEKLSIYLKPTKGEFKAEDVSFRTSNFPYDLVILVGVSSLEHLGDFYSQHAELFFDVALVNIDFRASNENYGQFNLVTLSATSCSEIVLDLVNKFESSLIDDVIATQLLTGIISETNSFQHVRTTPQTFLKASQLVSLGAKQQDIINSLYKTKSLGLLKLWGRVLARLKQDTNISLVYSAINQNDLMKSEAQTSDADAIIKEMGSQLGFAKIFMFLKEDSSNNTTAYLYTILPINLSMIFTAYSPQSAGPQTVKFNVNKPITEAENELVALLQNQIEKLKPVM
jgi:nanoRNase/pAp phosphatase (c-di-AMP/oligoRNAs hydrolase)